MPEFLYTLRSQQHPVHSICELPEPSDSRMGKDLLLKKEALLTASVNCQNLVTVGWEKICF